MTLSAILLLIGGALQAGGVSTSGVLSSVLHIAGGVALYLAKSPMGHGASDQSDTPPTGA